MRTQTQILLRYCSTQSTKYFLLKGLNVRVKYYICCWEMKNKGRL